MDRCAVGNTWPPDLAEFVSLTSESGANPFGLTSDRVMSEYRRWRNESYRFSGTDTVDEADDRAAATSAMTYCQAVLWIKPLLAVIEKGNNNFASIRQIELERKN